MLLPATWLTIDAIQYLKAIPLFQWVSEEYLGILAANLQTIKVSAGTSVTQEGTLDDSLYILLEGQCTVQTNPTITLTKKDFFGTQNVLAIQPARYTVQTDMDSTLLQLKHEFLFQGIAEDVQIAKSIIFGLSQRIQYLESLQNSKTTDS